MACRAAAAANSKQRRAAPAACRRSARARTDQFAWAEAAGCIVRRSTRALTLHGRMEAGRRHGRGGAANCRQRRAAPAARCPRPVGPSLVASAAVEEDRRRWRNDLRGELMRIPIGPEGHCGGAVVFSAESGWYRTTKMDGQIPRDAPGILWGQWSARTSAGFSSVEMA